MMVTEQESLLQRLSKALATAGNTNDAVKSFVQTLRHSSDKYDWVGVYLVKGEELVLEAYAGDAETEHVSIPIGQGICGFAAKTGKTIIVDDVNKDPRYLMCFPSTRSEIVVPIRGKTGVTGEIDIDSDKLSAFSPTDKKLLEQAAGRLARYLENDG